MVAEIFTNILYYIYNIYIIYIIKILSPSYPLLTKKTVFCILYPQGHF